MGVAGWFARRLQTARANEPMHTDTMRPPEGAGRSAALICSPGLFSGR
jgi:hypothetical protein